MRLARLDLDRYGRFTDVHLSLPSGESDFHVIYGPNEAGKSTTRNAISELLFGMDARTPYAFQHDYSDLRLGARLEADQGALEVVRLKRNKNPLVDANGQPIDSETWRQLLGTSDRSFFERMFALDHEQLVEGGQSMLDSSTDVGRALFQAAAGLGHFSKVRAELGNEAGQWWAGRSRKDVRYFMAKARMEEANKALKEHGLSESALKSLQGACAQAEAKAETAGQQRISAHARYAQLQRIRRVAPKLQQLASAETDAAVVAGDVLLPADARETFRAYTTGIASADSAIRQLEDSIEEQVHRQNAFVVDDALLAHAEEIDALVGELSSVESAAVDLPKRRVEREQMRREINQGLADLGLPAMEPADVLGRLLSAPQRERLRGLAEIHAEHERALASRRERLDAATSTLATLDAELARLAEEPRGTWDELIAGAAGVLDSANAKQLMDARTVADGTLRTALDTLGWPGTPEELRAMRPPEEASIATHLAAIAEQSAQLAESTRSRRAAESDLAQVDAEIAARRTDAVPDAETLISKRYIRDELVDALIAGTATLGNQGGELRERISDADGIADRRYAEAETAATLDGLLVRQAGLRARATTLCAQVEAIDHAAREVRHAWARTLAAAGMPDVELEAATAWIDGRGRVLKAFDDAERARATLAEFTVAATREADRLAAVLHRERPAEISAPDWLRSLLAAARAAQQEGTAQHARRAELRRQIDEQQTLLTREQAATSGMQVTLAAWNADWNTACTSSGLPAETLPRGLDRVLATIEAVRNRVAQFSREQEARIGPMERNVAGYEQRVRDTAGRAAADLSDRPPFEVVRTMAARLQVVRQASQSRAELGRSIEDQRAKLRIQRSQRDTALANLEPLLRLAGTADPDYLDRAIAASDRRRDLETAHAQLLSAVLEHGEGRDLAQLRAEVESIAVEQVDALLEATRLAELDAERQQEDARAEAVLAREKLRQREGNDSAARARSTKAMAQREMADAADAFIGLQTQSLLLDWALKRYREEKQAPLLFRASEYFSQLTCGEHARLTADGEGAAVRLSSRRAGPGSVKVPVEGMSVGTRDQLYLALRLAALDLHLEHNIALPFVADDLLVNFDDGRARAALQGLAKLGTRTQTLYFTHHRHLVDLARDALGESVNVIEL